MVHGQSYCNEESYKKESEKSHREKETKSIEGQVLGLFCLLCTWEKGKASVAMCMETLISLQLSARAPTDVCAGLERIVIEDLSIIKVVFRIICVYVYHCVSLNLLNVLIC